LDKPLLPRLGANVAATKLKSSPESKIQKLIDDLNFRMAVQKAAEAGVKLSTIEAAAYLGRSPASLSVWRCLKKGPKCEFSGTVPFYTKPALDEFIASCKTKRKVSPLVGRPPGRGKARRQAVR